MKLDHTKALVVLSGGQDSTTCLGWALQKFKSVYAVSFDYGQKHAAELNAAASVIQYFERKTGRAIPWETIRFMAGTFAGESPLTNSKNELERYTDHESMEKIIGDRVELTFVPMRNATFLTLAANRAATKGIGVMVTGVCQGDNANYPDCRQTFIWAQQKAINEALGLYDHSSNMQFMEIATPLMNLSKAKSIELARRTPHTYEALAFSHTAYDGSYPPKGDDHASVLRAHGFAEANLPDPLILRAFSEGLLDSLPETPNYAPEVVEPLLARLSPEWEL